MKSASNRDAGRAASDADATPDQRSEGERRLFEALVRDHSELLYVFITSCVGPSSLADEVHQDTLLTAWRRLPDFDQTRSFGAWLRGIARMHLRAHKRLNATRPALSEELLDGLEARFHALAQQPGDSLDDKLECLRECVSGLVERDQRALEIRYSDGLRGSPLAARLGTSVENAKKIVQRARARLLNCMQGKLSWEAL
ncbi:MAG: sigma-70 family RNA polymerase sigma factor [Planctomycetota bacterium]